MFVNRQSELEILESRWDSPSGEFLVLYGRRRVGKSLLLSHFAGQGRASLIFEATSGTSEDNLEDISREIAAFTGQASQQAQPFTSWRAVFASLGEIVEREKVMIALDEFQFIAREVQEVGSLVNRFVETNRENTNLFLVISGSDMSFFSDEVMGYGATTYGRRTGSHRLLPFRFTHIKELLPDFPIEDQIRAYAVFGGMPYYLAGVPGRGNLRKAILEEVLVPGAKLREEPEYLFAQESRIRDADVYKSIVRAVANGRTKPNEIAQRVGVNAGVIHKYLNVLYEMGLLAKTQPVTTTGRTRNFHIQVVDPFLRFWFRFVGPYQSRLIDRSRAERHLEQVVLPELDRFVSRPAFEEICRQWTEDAYPAAARVGSWWGSKKERRDGKPRNVSYEVDVAAVDADANAAALGSCKWSSAPDPDEAVRKLEVASEMLESPDADLLVFSRSEVDHRIRDRAEPDDRLRIVTLADL